MTMAMNYLSLLTFAVALSILLLLIGLIKKKKFYFFASFILLLYGLSPYILMVLDFGRIILVDYYLPDTYRSEVIFSTKGLELKGPFSMDPTIPRDDAIVYYQKDDETHIRVVKTGRELILPLDNPVFYFATPDKKYFFINFSRGKAYLIDQNLRIEKAYSFAGTTVKGRLDIGLYGDAWLDNHRIWFWVEKITFNLETSELLKVQSAEDIYFGKSVFCTDEKCYKVYCKNVGPLFDLSEAEKLMINSKDGQVGYLEESQISCLKKRAAEIVVINGGQTQGGWKLLLLGIDGDKDKNFVISIATDGFYGVNIESTVERLSKFFDARKIVKSDELRNYGLFQQDLVKQAKNGKNYKFEKHGGQLFLSTYHLSISHRTNIPLFSGSIRRRKMFLVGSENEKGELFIVTEKGIEKIIL